MPATLRPRDHATKVQARFRGFRTRRQILRAALPRQVDAGSARCMQLLHCLRVLASPSEQRRPVDTAMLAALFLQLELQSAAAEEGAPGFFEGKSDGERARLFDAMKLSCVEAGQVLWEQDDISDGKYYFIIGGRVEVRVEPHSEEGQARAGGMEALSTQLGCGCSFGERAAAASSTTQAKRTARVCTLEHCLFGTLDRPDFLRLTDRFHDVAVAALETPGDERTDEQVQLLESLLAESQFFRSLQFPSLSGGVTRCCKHKRLRKNEMLFKKGDDAKSFFVVVRGYVRVVDGGNVVRVLGPGSSFGEKGVTGGTAKERQRTATIVGGAVPGVLGSPVDGERPDSHGADVRCPLFDSFLPRWITARRFLLSLRDA